jgi:Ricin-type beta-trefoil lectin domain
MEGTFMSKRVIHRFALRIALSLTAALSLLTPALLASPAHAAQFYSEIIDHKSNLCMGVAAGTMRAGQPISQWDCQDPRYKYTQYPDQFWNLNTTDEELGGDADSSAVMIQDQKDSSFCLTAPNYTQGAQLVIEPCGGSWQPLQTWDVYWTGGRPSYATLRNDATGYVVGVSGGRTDHGAPISQWVAIAGDTDQMWQ